MSKWCSLGEHKDSPSRYLGGLSLCICSKFAPNFWSSSNNQLITDLRTMIPAQRKIPVVLSFLYHRHKAGIANDKQTVRWTFAVSGALWPSSQGLV